MSMNNPQVQIAKKVQTGLSDKHFLYITTHFERSDYESDGYNSVPVPDSGVLTITVNVKKTGEPLRLNKQVTHQVDLAGVELGEVEQFLVLVKEDNSTIASTTIVYQEETETVIRPIDETERLIKPIVE